MTPADAIPVYLLIVEIVLLLAMAGALAVCIYEKRKLKIRK